MAIVGEDKAYPLEKLKFDPQNARLHNERNIKSIMQSLKEFGQHAPLVVRTPDNIVVVGNGRLEAMRRLGWETAWVVFVDDDDEQALRRSLMDNRTAELAEWDEAVLEAILSDLDDLRVWWEEGGYDIPDVNIIDPEHIGHSFVVHIKCDNEVEFEELCNLLEITPRGNVGECKCSRIRDILQSEQ